MKKQSDIMRLVLALILMSPLVLAWIPLDDSLIQELGGYRNSAWTRSLWASFRELSISMGATLLVSMGIAIAFSWLGVLSGIFGRSVSSAFSMIESIPSILVALFFYAPVSGYLARHASGVSSLVSLAIFVIAASLTALPEAIRGITIPLSDLYYRKYSLSFRSYGFTKARILSILMASRSMQATTARVAASVLIKTLVLDCSFGFIIQLGFGSYGTPAHLSPGALIAANRDALFDGGTPPLFWIPTLFLVMITGAFILALDGSAKENKV